MKVVQLVMVFSLIGYGSVFGQGYSEKMGIGFSVNAQKLYGDTRSGSFVFGGNPINIRYQFSPHFYIDSDVGYSQLSADLNNSSFNTDLIHFGLKTGYRFRVNEKISPLLYVGFGLLNFKYQDGPVFWDGYGALGGGMEFNVTERVGLNFTGDFRYSTGDDFDGGSLATGRDGFFNIAFGLNYYLRGGSSFLNQPDLFTELPYQVAPVVQTEPEIRTTARTEPPKQTRDHGILNTQREQLTAQLRSKDELVQLLRAKNEVMQDRLLLIQKMVDGVNGNSSNGHATDGVTSKFRNSLLAYAGGQFQQTIEILRDLLTRYPKHAESSNWWYWLGESYFAAGDFDAADWAFQQTFAEGISQNKAETTKLMMGLSKWKSGDIAAAYTEFRELLRQEPHPSYEKLVQGYLAEIEINPDFQP